MRLPARWWVIAAGLLVLVGVLRVTACRPRPIEVEVVRVARGRVEDAVTNSQAGTVKARMRARVGVDRAGRVAAIPRREGAHAAKGEMLLLLDASTAETQLVAARRDLDAAHAAAEAARSNATLARQQHDRIASLFKSGVVSQGDMDQSKSALESAVAAQSGAEARDLSARSAVRQAENEIDHLRVLAPFDGIVSQRMVEVGESVIPGQPVLELVSLDHLYVSAPLDEIDIGRLAPGLPARVKLDPYPGLTWQGLVTRVSAVVNDVKEQNRTLEVEVALEPGPGRPSPRPGTSADVEIILDRHERVLRVPTFAVAENKRVMVMRGGRAEAREITIGLKNWDWTEVASGLDEGERVITNLDRQGLKPGVPVSAGKAGRERSESGTAEARTRTTPATR